MRNLFTFLALIVSFFARSRDNDDEIKRFLDTMAMGGQQHLSKGMPSFTLTSDKGEVTTDKDLNGKITVINFWFEACAPCIAEMGALNKLYETFQSNDKFNFISITYEKKQAIDSVRRKFDIRYPVYSTSREECYRLNFRNGFPTTIILDEMGKITFFTFGGDKNPQKEEMRFKTYLYPLLNCLLSCK